MLVILCSIPPLAFLLTVESVLIDRAFQILPVDLPTELHLMGRVRRILMFVMDGAATFQFIICIEHVFRRLLSMEIV